jgi:hypothetical protein
MYALYLYFLGLSFRSISKAIELFEVGVMWLSGNGHNYLRLVKPMSGVAAFVIDETMIQIGNDVA